MRLLTLSVGNTSLFGGIFSDGKLGATFRTEVGRVIPNPPLGHRTSDQPRPTRRIKDNPPYLGAVRGTIDRIVLCSVVPSLTAPLVRALRERHGIDPAVLTTNADHGLKIGYARPQSLGTDRLAAALGAKTLFPGTHVIVVDCGTATTVTALHRNGTLLGGAIFPGLALWPEMLAARTAQLPLADLRRPKKALGRSTEAGIAAGIFHGHAGAIRELVTRVRREAFGRAPVIVVGTGGHAWRFKPEKIFDALEPALVLHGLSAFAEQSSRL